ncbi:MAG: hypothetical protein J6S44_03240 [Clostridia bacterium]|nr:hypothetical protein [Clostridia bacterium]
MTRPYGILYESIGTREPLYVMRRLKAAGFSSMELFFGTASPQAVCEAARLAELEIEAARLPSDGANLLWDNLRVWNNLHAFYKTYFTLAASHGIRRLVFCPSTGRTPPPVTQWGLERLEILAEDAKAAGVCLLVENGESKPHFEAAACVMCRYGNEVSFRIHSSMEHYGTAVPPACALPHVTRVVLEENKAGYERPLFGRTDMLTAADRLVRGTALSTLTVRQEWQEENSPEVHAALAYDTAYRFEQILRNGEARL